MKKSEVIALRILQGVAVSLLTIVIVAIGYAALQLASGNIRSTACFEF